MSYYASSATCKSLCFSPWGRGLQRDHLSHCARKEARLIWPLIKPPAPFPEEVPHLLAPTSGITSLCCGEKLARKHSRIMSLMNTRNNSYRGSNPTHWERNEWLYTTKIKSDSAIVTFMFWSPGYKRVIFSQSVELSVCICKAFSQTAEHSHITAISIPSTVFFFSLHYFL